MEKLNLTWVIAHEPKYLFYRVAEDFKNIVNKTSNDVEINIEILTDDEFNEKFNPTKFLQDNTVQIAQMQTTSLAKQFNRDMYVLDMPYLFESHSQVSETLEGEVGQYLLNSFDTDSKIKGLAFTYSGGFRLMPVNGSVKSLDELIGQPVRSGMSEIAQETIKTFGFDPIPTEIDETSDAVISGRAVGAEHVAQRLFPDQCEKWIDTIVDTKHSLFLTSIVVNIDWWNSLPKSVQAVFQNAASEAARNERDLSIKDGLESLEKLKSQGVAVIELSESQMDSLKEKTKAVYEKFNSNFFKTDILSRIKNG